MYWYLKCLRQYADFTGRARRKEFWMFTLVNTIIYIIMTIGLILFLLNLPQFSLLLEEVMSLNDDLYLDDEEEFHPLCGTFIIWLLVVGLYSLITYLPGLAVTVRRFHDQDQSGWMALIYLVPYIGSFIILVFMCIKGTPGENRFGPSPLPEEQPPSITEKTDSNLIS